MSHCHHEHAEAGGHSHGHPSDQHDHSDDITPALQRSLYEHILFDQIVTLNESRPDTGRDVVRKTWAQRLDTQPELVSDADEQLLMTVPFSAQIKLHSILLRTSGSAAAPRTLRVFVNRDDLDFAAAEDTAPAQEFELAQTSDVVEIPVRRAVFGNVRRLVLFFVDSFGDRASRLSYLGFRGEWMPVGRAPVNLLYEAVPNPSDHALKGTVVSAIGSGIEGHRHAK